MEVDRLRVAVMNSMALKKWLGRRSGVDLRYFSE
jgi:hypothetical protein